MYKRSVPSIECIILFLSALSTEKVTPLHGVRVKTNYSMSNLEITASFLCDKKLISSRRGVGGGYRLLKSTEEIKLKDLISFIPDSHKTLAKTFKILSETNLSDFVKYK